MKVVFGTNGKLIAQAAETSHGYEVALSLEGRNIDTFTVHEWELAVAAMADLARKVRSASSAKFKRTSASKINFLTMACPGTGTAKVLCPFPQEAWPSLFPTWAHHCQN